MNEDWPHVLPQNTVWRSAVSTTALFVVLGLFWLGTWAAVPHWVALVAMTTGNLLGVLIIIGNIRAFSDRRLPRDDRESRQ